MSEVNKVIFAGAVLLDLTSDTVTEDVIIDGYTGHDAAGNKITGKLKIITVDEALDANSTNPLQNKAIVSALEGKLSTTGNAASATKLTSSEGTNTKPVYFSDGKPVACTYSLNADVPIDAKFTDTLYTHPDNHPASMITGLSKVATSGNYTDLSNKPTIPSSLPANGGNADTVGGFTVGTNVPSNAVFTDTKYILPNATSNVLGGVKIGSNISVSDGTISISKTNVTNALGYTPLQTAPVLFPDYSAGINVGASTTEKSYTCPADGVICVCIGGFNYTYGYLYIDGQQMFNITSSTNAFFCFASGQYAVKKNTVVRFRSGYQNLGGDKFIFYPYK